MCQGKENIVKMINYHHKGFIGSLRHPVEIALMVGKINTQQKK
jgi:hypothetical protein